MPPISDNRSHSPLVLFFKGFCMGCADIIPGISGGTIAFIMGIYEDLIHAIRSFDKEFFLHLATFRVKEAFRHCRWRFLSILCCGILSAILLLSKIVHWLLHHHPVYLYAFFFGLILATVPLIMKIVKRWRWQEVFFLLLFAVGTYFFVELTPVNTPESAWFVFLSGAIAICAMILPGISGAFILVLLGKYEFILAALNQRDVISLGVFLLGAAVGILTFAQIVDRLLKRFHDSTLAALSGVVIGSLNKIWPWKITLASLVTAKGKVIPLRETNILPDFLSWEFATAFCLAAVGFAVALLIDRKSP